MEVKTPVYFGVSRELFHKLSRKAREMGTSRSGVAGAAVRAYLAAPFPVRGYRLERGEQFRRIATFLTAQEHAKLRALAQEFGTDEQPVSVSTIIREAVVRFVEGGADAGSSEEAPPEDIIPTVPLAQVNRPEEPAAGDQTEGAVLSRGRAPRTRREGARKDGRGSGRRRARPGGRS